MRSRRFGGTTWNLDETGTAVAVDGSGNVVITGIASGEADFGGGPIGTGTFFAAKFSPAGDYLWSRQAPGRGFGIAVDGSANVIVTGSFLGTTDFGAGPITSPMGWAIFVTKYSPAGTPLWSKGAGGWLGDSGTAVAVDAAGNVLVTGVFGNWLNFGTGWLRSGGGDIFLAKLTGSGAPVWVKAFSGGGVGLGVAADSSGNVIFTGGFSSSLDLGGGILPGASTGGIFVAKYSPSGNHLWSQGFADPTGDYGTAVTVDGSGNVSVTGVFTSTVDFGTGPVRSAGGADVFLLHRAP